MMFLLFIAIAFNLEAKKRHVYTSVAIVIDENIYGAVKEAVAAYSSSIRENDGKGTYIIVAPQEASPEFIRDSLKILYTNHGLEGAVLVGDIPIPMIRRAHYLTTAFKMDPKNPWKASSVPSDRFYDDFDLSFDFLKQDEKNKALYYYDLSYPGVRRVECDIYSARVKPSKVDTEHTFSQLISEFLLRAASAKGKKERLDRAFHFGGHGNSSESFNARIDENRAMYEQFAFYGPDEKVSYINFDEDKYVKSRFSSILADKGLDYAHIHTHGSVKAQYLSKEPYTFTTSGHIDFAKAALRSKMRKASDAAAAKEEILRGYGVTETWVAGWDDPEIIKADSLERAMVDLTLPDMDGYRSGVKVLILDACFNGAFIHDDYVAARYAFGPGSSTMAVFGNSVNIIQDHWKNELAGLLGYGVCVGNWAKMNMTLESHIFGDPTYAFSSRDERCSNFDLMVSRGGYAWKKKEEAGLSSDVYSYLLKKRYENDMSSDAEILDVLKNDKRMNVRMEAFMSIMRKGVSDEIFVKAVETGLNDPYEMLRRMASSFAEKAGHSSLIKVCVERYLNPEETARIRYHLSEAMALYPAKDILPVVDSVYSSRFRRWPDNKAYEALVQKILTSWKTSEEAHASLDDVSVAVKERRFIIRMQRNKCRPGAVEPMLRLIANEQDEALLRAEAAEALGWYVYSCRRQYILETCSSLLKKVDEPEIRKELERTVFRLKRG